MPDTPEEAPKPPVRDSLAEVIKSPENLEYARAIIDEYCDQQNFSGKFNALQKQWAIEAAEKARKRKKP